MHMRGLLASRRQEPQDGSGSSVARSTDFPEVLQISDLVSDFQIFFSKWTKSTDIFLT